MGSSGCPGFSFRARKTAGRNRNGEARLLIDRRKGEANDRIGVQHARRGETGRYEHPRRDRIYERPEYLPLGEESPR